MEFIGKFDRQCYNCISNLKFRGLQLVQSARYIIFVQIKTVLKNLFEMAIEKIMIEYKKRQDAIIMGKKDIFDKGSASFYLNKITEGKSNGGRGKIE